jgi:hypothetical protein
MQYTKPYPVTVGADGRATATITPDRGYPWHVTQVSVKLPLAPLGATCELRKNGAFITDLIATGDAAVEPPAIDLQFGDQLQVLWGGLTPGQSGEVTAVYDELVGG